jgi:hypothetical protein
MSQPSPGNCPVQIQVYVDTNAAKQNSTDGVYMVDNRVNSGSTGEGSLGLDTHVSKASNVCLQVINIDATSDVTVEFTSFGNSNAWEPRYPPCGTTMPRSGPRRRPTRAAISPTASCCGSEMPRRSR